jgi:hypothetical protein
VVQGNPFCQVRLADQSVRDDDPAVPLAKGAKICTARARQLWGEKDDQARQRIEEKWENLELGGRPGSSPARGSILTYIIQQSISRLRYRVVRQGYLLEAPSSTTPSMTIKFATTTCQQVKQRAAEGGSRREMPATQP